MPSLFEHAGGEAALHRLEQTFYDSVLRDPLLQPLFGAGRPEHVAHLTMFTAESFGGPARFTKELGFAHLIAVHRGLAITEEQRLRSSRCRTRTRPATSSCTRSARSRAGPGRATTAKPATVYHEVVSPHVHVDV